MPACLSHGSPDASSCFSATEADDGAAQNWYDVRKECAANESMEESPGLRYVSRCIVWVFHLDLEGDERPIGSEYKKGPE